MVPASGQRTSKVCFPDEVAHVCLFDPDDPPSSLTEVPTIQLPPPAGATIIVAVVTDTATGKPQVLVGGITYPQGHRQLLGVAGTAPLQTRDDAVDSAAGITQRLGLAQHAVLLAGEMGAAHADDDDRVRLVVAWVPRAAHETVTLPSPLEWCDHRGLDPAAYRFAVAAVQRVRATHEPNIHIPSELILGAASRHRPRLRTTPAERDGCASVEERVGAANAACGELRELLRSQSDGSPEWREFAARMADRVGDVELASIPPSLRDKRFDLAGLEDKPFRHIRGRVKAGPLPKPVQPADDGWRPHWVEDVFTEEALKELIETIGAITKWCADMMTKRSKAVEQARPTGIALGLDALKPRARALIEAGNVFDLRHGPGDVRLTEFTKPIIPPEQQHLDAEFIRNALS